MINLTWRNILESFTKNPRDVITRRDGVWFYTYGDGEKVYIESAKNHARSSKITSRRVLDCKNFEKIYGMYVDGIPRSEVRNVTQNSSYWFGIFASLLNEI